MSRFGATGLFTYNVGNNAGTFEGGTTVILEESDMPQFPMEEGRITDEVQYRAKSGKKWSYRNYNKKHFVFNWTNLTESMRNELGTMAHQLPAFSFSTGGNDFGTFLLVPDTLDDMETSYELYDFSFEAEEM